MASSTIDLGNPLTDWIQPAVAVAQPFFDLFRTPGVWIIGIILGLGLVGWIIYHFRGSFHNMH